LVGLFLGLGGVGLTGLLGVNGGLGFGGHGLGSGGCLGGLSRSRRRTITKRSGSERSLENHSSVPYVV